LREIRNAPEAFRADTGEEVSFAKFARAGYRIRFDTSSWGTSSPHAVVHSRIDLETFLPRTHPVIDLLVAQESDIQSVEVDGAAVGSYEVFTPADEGSTSLFRILGESISAGPHRVDVVHTLRKGIELTETGFRFFAGMWDHYPDDPVIDGIGHFSNSTSLRIWSSTTTRSKSTSR
jgi:hypothetical protein